MSSIKISLIALISCSALYFSSVATAEEFSAEEVAKLKDRCRRKPDDPACKVLGKVLEHARKRCLQQPEKEVCKRLNEGEAPLVEPAPPAPPAQ